MCNLVLFAGLAAVGYWYLYPLLWVLPFMTYHMAITRVRNIAEHAIVPDNDDPFRNARTTETNWFTRIFLAPYGVNYHVEHHLVMWVPPHRLPLLQKFLKDNGYWERMETAPGYVDILKRATSKPDDQDRPGKLVHNARLRRVKGSFGEGFDETETKSAA